MKFCPKCGNEYAFSKKCTKCGVPTHEVDVSTRYCETCGRVLTVNELYCGHEAKPSEPNGEKQSDSSTSSSESRYVRRCKTCGRELEADEIVCRHCAEEQSKRVRISLDDLSESADKKTPSKKDGSVLGCISGLIVPLLLFAAGFFLLNDGLHRISDSDYKPDDDYYYTPVYDNDYSSNKTVEPSTKKELKDEDFVFKFGSSSDAVAEVLSDNDVYYYSWEDTTLMKMSGNEPSSLMYGRPKEESFGNALVASDWDGNYNYSAVKYFGYSVAELNYSFLYPVVNGKVSTLTDELVTVTYELNVLDYVATYEDLHSVLVKKYGEPSLQGSADMEIYSTWNFTDNTNLTIFCNYDPDLTDDKNYYQYLLVSYYVDDANARLDELEAVRKQEALERENAIRENRE